MSEYVLSVDKSKPVEIKITDIVNDDVIFGRISTYRLDYDIDTTAVILLFSLESDPKTFYGIKLMEEDTMLLNIELTPQEIFFRIINFLGEVIHSAKSIGQTLVMKLDNQNSQLFVKDLTKTEDTYRIFNGGLLY